MHVVSESNVCPSTSSIRNVSNICRSVPYATCIWAGGSGRPEGQVASISLGQPRAASGILKIRAAPFFKRLRVDRWIHRGRLELSSQLDVSSQAGSGVPAGDQAGGEGAGMISKGVLQVKVNMVSKTRMFIS